MKYTQPNTFRHNFPFSRFYLISKARILKSPHAQLVQKLQISKAILYIPQSQYNHVFQRYNKCTASYYGNTVHNYK